MPLKQPKRHLLILTFLVIFILFLGIFDLWVKYGEPLCESFRKESTIPLYFLVHAAEQCFIAIAGLGIILPIIPCVWYVSSEQLRPEWIRGEWKLLVALRKDIEYVSEEGIKINGKATQIWASRGQLVTVPEIRAYGRWAETTVAAVTKAEHWDEANERLNQRIEFPKLFVSFWDLRGRFFLDQEEKSIKAELQGVRMKYKDAVDETSERVKTLQSPFHAICAQGMCGSLLERLVSNVRSLQERPRVDAVYKLGTLAVRNENWRRQWRSSVNEKYYYYTLPLHLLLDYLQDLEGIILETETGKAWVQEAEEILGELQHDVDSILNTANGTGWLSKLMVKYKLGNLWESMETMISDHFRRKEVYGITFVRRVASKSVVHPFPLSEATIQGLGILDLVDVIHNWLSLNSNSGIFGELSLLRDHFKKVHNLLIDAANADDVFRHSGKAWTDQMEDIVERAKVFFNTHRTIESNELKEIRRFECALSLVELSIKVCRIELREEINWVVGLEEDIQVVVPRLTSNSEDHFTLSIVGMKGIGKTTLARVIYNHTDIQNHFKEFRYLVTLPDKVDDVNVLKLLGEKVLPNLEEQNGNQNWIQMVSDFLQDKNYLLILDNISTNETWDTLKAALPERSKGSRIVLTTRDRSVASHADQTCNLHQLRLRTKDESWDLFTQMVPFGSEPSSSQSEEQSVLEALAMKAVGRCGGLPLSIVHLGYLMSGKKVTAEELSELGNSNHNQTAWSDNLEIYREHLPSQLKDCLSYIQLFPRDYEIPRRRLVNLWVAEAFVQESGDDEEPLESVAEKNLTELIGHNLVQVVKRKINGKVKTCGLPSALRELWKPDSSNPIFNPRVAYSDENGFSLPKEKNLLSILFFDNRDLNRPGEHIGNLLREGIASRHLLQLQVLDLEHVFRPQLLNTLERLTHLTYLGLRSTYLETLPSSIGKLVNLQTLDLKHTYIHILPKSIWKLQKLRHLYLNRTYRTKFVHHQGGKYLRSLQTLQGAFVDKDSLMDGLQKLTNLRKLALAFQLNPLQQEVMVQMLEKFTRLQTLKLRSVDEMGKPKDLNVNSLSGLINLSKLYLFGNLQNPFFIINITNVPRSVTDLSLSATRISKDPMTELEKLPNLKWLNFYSNSYIGTKLVCSKVGFPQLLVLKFWMLKELQEWDVEEQAMPNLEQLEIRSCISLKVPTGLRHLKNLRELKLQDSQKFTTEIERSKDQIWGDIALCPAIIIDKL